MPLSKNIAHYIGKSLGIFLFVLLLLSAILGCANQATYLDQQSQISVQQVFSGPMTAHGVVKNRSGQVTRHFNATIDASWDESGIGLLDEKFVFDDGEVQYRKWTLKPIDDSTFEASANDVVEPTTLRVIGNSLQMVYVLRIPYKDGEININMDDRMYLVQDHVIINETKMSKFGFSVGEVVLTIIKQ